MNLDNLNLVELNAQEMKETEGGFWGLLIVGIILLAAVIFANDDNPDTITTVNGTRVGV